MNTLFYVTNHYNILPIPLDIVKSFLRVTHQEDDALITMLIRSAINYAENKFGIVIGKKDYEYKLYAHSQSFTISKPYVAYVNFVTVEGGQAQYTQNCNTIIITPNCINKLVCINFTCDNPNFGEAMEIAVMKHVFYLYEHRSVTEINSREIESVYSALFGSNYSI